MIHSFPSLILALTLPAAAPLDVEPEDLRPGLVAEYKSRVEERAVLSRIEAKPAFTLGDSSPHPRLPPGAFDVTWTGAILIRELGAITFEAYAGGEVSLDIDNVRVLEGQAKSESPLQGKKSLERPAGLYRLTLRFRTLDGVPPRLQLWWQGPSFSREPIPAWRFSHVVSEQSVSVRADERAGKGKQLAERMGCAHCHAHAFPGMDAPPPGPALVELAGRFTRPWLMRWLADPSKVHADTQMPALFGGDETGHAERWLIGDHLAKPAPARVPAKEPATKEPSHRQGRLAFLSVGCVACHFIPDMPRAEQKDLDRTPLRGLGDRLGGETLASFLANPHGRYPDGRMPKLPLTPVQARDIAAYLLLWSPPSMDTDDGVAPRETTLATIRQRLKADDNDKATVALLREKGCIHCHVGLDQAKPANVPVKSWAGGCLSSKTLPRFPLSDQQRALLADYGKTAAAEKFPSPFAARQRQLDRAGCVRCHARDTDRPAPLEEASSTLGGAFLQFIPFQRTPRLTYPHQKFTQAHLLETVAKSTTGLRAARFTFRMPEFGDHAKALVQALAEADGEPVPAPDEPKAAPPLDPTAASLHGPRLVGFQGYSCVACHIWKGQRLSEGDPGNVGTELTRVAGRIRRDWFDRFLEDPGRFHPGTPMPGIFPKDKPAQLASVLDGDALKQKDALWHYFALGAEAPSPKPPPPLPVSVPAPSSLIAQVPMHLPDGTLFESITLLTPANDLVVYDVGSGRIHSIYVGGQVLRHVQGRLRKYSADGTLVPLPKNLKTPLKLVGGPKPEEPLARTLDGFDHLEDGVRLRWQVKFPSGTVRIAEEMHIVTVGQSRRFIVETTVPSLPPGRKTQVFAFELPAPKAAPNVERFSLADPGRVEGSLERPGYRAFEYHRPKTISGEDLVMPGAVAVHPRDGRVFVASMKMGEIFVLREPSSKNARFENYGRGLFQEAYSMLAEDDGLYVLHRRNLSKLVERKGGDFAESVERVLALPHGVGNTYDYGYGLARDKSGAFVYTFAPHANRTLPGSGAAVRHKPGEQPEEFGYGFRNPLGWCAGPDGDIFMTDNQGEWVATNKLCHVANGRFYGYPNREQPQHAKKPFGKTAVWVPYGWARSINGMTYDNTGGKFGPFAGQFFLAELMYGGAIIRAHVEKVNGEYQGSCFPFWGKGLLGPVTLAFDKSRGPLYVGSITEPGWMAMPDRGALYRIDYTGKLPFEIHSINVQPRGFRINFTRPVDPATARDVKSYHLEHYRYEYTGAYGSPELDRTQVTVEKIEVAADGKSVTLTTAPLVADRVYMIGAAGVRSTSGEPLVHDTGAYTLNEVPK